MWVLYIFWRSNPVRDMICKYIFPYGRFPIHFAVVLFSHAEAFYFDEVPFVYSFLYAPCSRGHIGKNSAAWNIWEFPPCVLLQDFFYSAVTYIWKWTHDSPKLTGHSKGVPEREVHNNTGLCKKIETSQSNNLTLHIQKLGKQKQTKPRASGRKEITKITAELNSIETKRTIVRINISRRWFFEKINKIDKPVIILIKKKGQKTQVNKIRSERGEVTTDTTEIQRIVRNYDEELYAKKCQNLGEMDTFQEKYNLPKLNEEEAQILNRQVTADEIKAIVKILPAHKSLQPKL